MAQGCLQDSATSTDRTFRAARSAPRYGLQGVLGFEGSYPGCMPKVFNAGLLTLGARSCGSGVYRCGLAWLWEFRFRYRDAYSSDTSPETFTN